MLHLCQQLKLEARRDTTASVTVVERYDVAADAKKRINLRNAKTKYFHVKAFSNGAYLLEPRVLVPPESYFSADDEDDRAIGC